MFYNIVHGTRKRKKGKDKFEAGLFLLRREKSISREVPRGQLYCSSLVGFLAILLTILLAQVQCTCIVHLFHLQFAYYTKPKCLLFRVSLSFFLLSKMTYSDNLNCFDFLNYLPMCIYTGCLILKRAF